MYFSLSRNAKVFRCTPQEDGRKAYLKTPRLGDQRSSYCASMRCKHASKGHLHKAQLLCRGVEHLPECGPHTFPKKTPAPETQLAKPAAHDDAFFKLAAATGTAIGGVRLTSPRDASDPQRAGALRDFLMARLLFCSLRYACCTSTSMPPCCRSSAKLLELLHTQDCLCTHTPPRLLLRTL